MLTAALVLVLALAALGLLFFSALLIGMRNEPAHGNLTTNAPSPLAAMTRRMLGVSVRKPANRRLTNDPDAPDADEPRQPWFAGAGYTPSDRDDERW
jgi:hypothetical protein